jgi:AbiV family abortive infection protein
MNATAPYLLAGSHYALVQCGKLLTSAAILYNAGDHATAMVLAAFAHEELGRSRILRGQGKKVLDGKPVSITGIRAACENHVMKQKWGQLSVDYKFTSKSVATKVLPILTNPESPECHEARRQLEVGIKKKKSRAPEVRHEERMRSLYVEPNGGGSDWNKPWETNKELAKQFVQEAIDNYLFLAKRRDLNDLRLKDPKLAQAVEACVARPNLLPVPRLT